uniref:Uncharacterized protein n=1 Tax=Nicotiana tabacum TaxID=4097 RepID=A0A1S4DGB1_TOBAC
MNRDLYQSYNRDRRGNRHGHNSIRGKKRSKRGQGSQGLISKNGFDRHTGPKEAPRLSEYNFNVDASAIVSAIGRIKNTKWPRPLQTNPAQRNPNQVCIYHGTHGHRTEDCRQLRDEVARLFNEGHLREFLRIDVPQGPVFKRTKVSIVREKRSRAQDYIPKGTLSFNDEDAEGIMQPYNDAL